MKNLLTLDKISMPITEYASQGNAILGIRDSGKSYTATYIAERLLDQHIPFVAFDPIGIWKFLKVKGKKQGYPIVVAGGKNPDLPLTPQSAPEIVRAAMRENIPLVIDLYDIHLSKSDWRKIVEDCIRILLYENGEYGLRHIFIEEAAEFCPQNVGNENGRVYAEVEKLARMGGNALLGYTLINQRAEQVNKAVLELCDCLFLHRQKGKNSITSLSKWLDIGTSADTKPIIESLPRLGQGDCWVWPSGSDQPVRVKIPKKNTFHPDRRAIIAGGKVKSKSVDVSKFVKQMSGSLEKHIEASKQEDPKYLRGEIARLNKELANRPTEKPITQIVEVKVPVLSPGETKDLSFALETVKQISNTILSSIQGATTIQTPRPTQTPQPVVRSVVLPPMRDLPTPRDTNGKLPKAEKKILNVLAQYPQGRSASQIAVLAVYSGSGGGFTNALSSLKTSGYMIGERDNLQITQAGLDALGSFEPLPIGHGLLEYWYRNLPHAERSILKTLASVYPNEMSLEEIAANTMSARGGPYEASGGGFTNAISGLRTRELIDGKTLIKASDKLFG